MESVISIRSVIVAFFPYLSYHYYIISLVILLSKYICSCYYDITLSDDGYDKNDDESLSCALLLFGGSCFCFCVFLIFAISLAIICCSLSYRVLIHNIGLYMVWNNVQTPPHR
jgi:cellulose synthase/poly-beta-1,6-N-acetylglucosamine synthase-like glycosyltransferase